MNNMARLTLDEVQPLLTNPNHHGSDLTRINDFFECSITKQRYPIINNESIDFLSGEISSEKLKKFTKKKTLIFKLNEYYNRHLEQRIYHSILAAGGPGIIRNDIKVTKWLSTTKGIILDVGCGDNKLEKFIPNGSKYIPLDYAPAAFSSPWRETNPQINADGMKLPFKSKTLDCVINLMVIEHVTQPSVLIKELSRVLRPGGVLILSGPGDITLSHGEPHNYYNLTRHAYKMLLESNNMSIVEDYYPSRFWMSISMLIYHKIVRNNWYNKNSLTKLLQLIIFIISLPISPLINLIAQGLDFFTPFDHRGYSIYTVLCKKNSN